MPIGEELQDRISMNHIFKNLDLKHTCKFNYDFTIANNDYNNSSLSIENIPDLPKNRIRELNKFRKLQTLM